MQILQPCIVHLLVRLCTFPLISSNYLTIFIRRVTLNTELDTVSLFARHSQITQFGVYPLVFSFSIWPGQGFYVELFLIYAFASEYQTKTKRPFSLFLMKIKNDPLQPFCGIPVKIEKMFINSYIILSYFHRERRSFPLPLVSL